jgi:hypothetical protein
MQVQKGLSALPPIATAIADSRSSPCPLYPRKRTFRAANVMSALCQYQTFCQSFDHRVGALLKMHGDVEAERLGGL